MFISILLLIYITIFCKFCELTVHSCEERVYTMMYVAICDDNKPMLDFLNGKVDIMLTENKLTHEITVFSSGADFLECHAKRPFDIVFLDIVMPEPNGFETAKQVRKISRDTYIIFITTESSLVYESFDFQPFYFIPKGKPKTTEDKLEYVVKRLSLHMAATEKIMISGAYENKRYVSPNEILYIKSSINNIEYHFADGASQAVRGRLDTVSASLNAYIFARTHNRFIVNMNHIDITDYPNMEIRLDNGELIGISRGYKKEFEEAYIRFTRNFG